MVGNLFGTIQRTRYLFRDTLDGAAADGIQDRSGRAPAAAAAAFATTHGAWSAAAARPQRAGAGMHDNDRPAAAIEVLAGRRRPVHHAAAGLHRRPRSARPPCPLEPGHVSRATVRQPLRAAIAEVGLHYQIHRGIGVHHAAAMRTGEPLRVNIFVGGPPAMTVAAVMPLPEGMSRTGFAGALGGRARADDPARPAQLPIYAEADFCITGTVEPERQLPEGPFGDHLGYYSLAHDFPCCRVEQVYHRPRCDLAVHGRRPAAAGRHDVRRSSFTN